MLEVAMYTTIKTLYEKGCSKSEIARVTGHDWKTVDKIIKQIKDGKPWSKKASHPSKLDSYKTQIKGLLEHNLTGVRVFEEIQKDGAPITYSTVKRYIAKIKKRDNVCIRFHTQAGEESQVDFGYVGFTIDNDGKRRKTWVFNMRLSYSRLDYFEKVYDQKVETFIQCHANAFKFFSGVPEYVKIDNLKAAILEANFYEPIYQSLYKQFADYYKFKIMPCRVRKPQEKGKTESGIKYVKGNFFAGRKFINGNDLDKQLMKWLENTCNKRVHGTTRKIPNEVFEAEERNKLIQLPEQDFSLPKMGQRLVYHDSHIYIDYNYYSVPSEYVGEKVDIEINKDLVKIDCQGKQIAIHARLKGRGEFSTSNSHYPWFKLYLSTEYQGRYQEKMNQLGEDAGKLFLLILKKHPTEWNRMTQGILSLSKKFSTEIVNLACRRALAFQICRYRIIRNICENGSYKLPLEFRGEIQ